MNEPEMRGERKSPEAGDIRFEHVSFAYQDKEVLHDVTVTLPPKLIDGSRRSFGKREKHGDETLCPFLRPTTRTHLLWRCADGQNSTRKPDETHLYGLPRCLSVSRHHTQQHPFRQDGCNGRGNHCRRQESLLPRLHHALAARLRHDGGRRRLYLVWRRKNSAYPLPAPY